MKICLRATSAMLALFTAITVGAASSDWPQWRGPYRNGHASADAPAVNSLPSELRPVWRIHVGGGFSSPVVSGGKLVFLDEQGGQEVAHLLDAGTGKEIWKVLYAPVFQDEWGAGPRS